MIFPKWLRINFMKRVQFPSLAFTFLLVSFANMLSGCAQIELASHLGKKLMPGSSQHSTGAYKIGSPYTIRGKRYYPAVDYNYDQTGIASWYGPNFHGKQTANGEIYNQNDLTAAHKTLPLPSIVRVTNLENGRSLIVRVNDRGPYAHGRIIDMSKRSAELLGFTTQGTAKVRVQILEAESRRLAQIAMNGGDTKGMEVPMNKSSYKSPSVQRASYAGGQRTASGSRIAGAHDIFVQVGAFSTRENAMMYASALDQYGRGQVSEAIIDGKRFYRVRFPAQNVVSADRLLSAMIRDGYENAMIVVD
ncbi:MAG: septal ring lytic transglycosylase RlpA family protein [Alphaproteobacteria bacterium]